MDQNTPRETAILDAPQKPARVALVVLALKDLTPEGVIKLSLGKKRHVLLKPA